MFQPPHVNPSQPLHFLSLIKCNICLISLISLNAVVCEPSSTHHSSRRLYQKVQFHCVPPIVWALWQSRSLTTHPVSIGSFYSVLWWKHSHLFVKITFSGHKVGELNGAFLPEMCISCVLSPVSAFYAECLSKKIQFNAHIWTKSKFLGMSIGVHNIGQGCVSCLEHDEHYIVTFPNGYGRLVLLLVSLLLIYVMTFLTAAQPWYG